VLAPAAAAAVARHPVRSVAHAEHLRVVRRQPDPFRAGGQVENTHVARLITGSDFVTFGQGGAYTRPLVG
jgi:hypothetical protein